MNDERNRPLRLNGWPPVIRRRQWLGGAGALALGTLGAAGAWPTARAQPAAGEGYEPRRGQAGKDVIWIPTPDRLVQRMLRLAQLTPQDYLIDLGSGDGKIVIAAAREGARALGIEYNPDLVALSRRRAEQAQLADRARFERADIFETDFSQASVITMYLLPQLNLRLRHRLLALAPGTRVVSHEFRMGRWEPDESAAVGHAWLHLWTVPANVGGQWRLSFAQGGQTLTLPLYFGQSFQQLHGHVVYPGFAAHVRQARVAGRQVSFGFTDELGHLRQFSGQLQGQQLTGMVQDVTAGGAPSPFSAQRLDEPKPFDGAEPAPESEAESLGEG